MKQPAVLLVSCAICLALGGMWYLSAKPTDPSPSPDGRNPQERSSPSGGETVAVPNPGGSHPVDRGRVKVAEPERDVLSSPRAGLTDYEHETLTRRLVAAVTGSAKKIERLEGDSSLARTRDGLLQIAEARLEHEKNLAKLEQAGSKSYFVSGKGSPKARNSKDVRWIQISTALLDYVNGERVRSRRNLMYRVTREKNSSLFAALDQVASMRHEKRMEKAKAFNLLPYDERVRAIEASRLAHIRADEIHKQSLNETNAKVLQRLRDEYLELRKRFLPDGLRVNKKEFTLRPR